MSLTRRRFVASAALTGALALTPRLALAAAPTEARFVFIILRGAMDGLGVVMPVVDPAYARLRGKLAQPAAGAPVKLDGSFALHPALVRTASLYAKREALFVHAVASPYRERSHFDGQNVIETGGTAAYALKDGWLNRLVAALPGARDAAIAIAPTVPMALRGPAPAGSYAPSALPDASAACSRASPRSTPTTRCSTRSGTARSRRARSPWAATPAIGPTPPRSASSPQASSPGRRARASQ